MIAIIDYGAGNIKSVEKAVQFLGHEAVTTNEKDILLSADKVILPGVGHFGSAMQHIRELGLEEVIKTITGSGTPFMGICLGLQLLFDESEEAPGVKGLSVLPGKILRIPRIADLKIPHMGWNSVSVNMNSRLFSGINSGSYVYFVHSYYLRCSDDSAVAATTEYGTLIHAAVESGNVFACQFHPEKSSDTGLKILQNFINI